MVGDTIKIEMFDFLAYLLIFICLINFFYLALIFVAASFNHLAEEYADIMFDISMLYHMEIHL